jgi:hypothetical protein
VVEVLHSGQLSLYSGRRRPHFRQNGICSLQLFRCMMVCRPLNFDKKLSRSYLNV